MQLKAIKYFLFYRKDAIGERARLWTDDCSEDRRCSQAFNQSMTVPEGSHFVCHALLNVRDNPQFSLEEFAGLCYTPTHL
jgi:hypothetical protein